jgi:ATP-dependent 26S proteasome regulatory subunit
MYVAVVVCCGSSLPSAQDVTVAFSRPLGVLLYGTLGTGTWLIWRGM